jgi:hypothetical protein
MIALTILGDGRDSGLLAVSVAAAAAQPIATPHPSNPFRIEAPHEYAAGDWLGSTSLASQGREKS